MDNLYPMKAIIKYEDVKYEGMIYNFESYSNSPHVALSSYKISKNGTVDDCTNIENKIIILDTSSATSVEILYDKRSYMCEDLKALCESNKTMRW